MYNCIIPDCNLTFLNKAIQNIHTFLAVIARNSGILETGISVQQHQSVINEPFISGTMTCLVTSDCLNWNPQTLLTVVMSRFWGMLLCRYKKKMINTYVLKCVWNNGTRVWLCRGYLTKAFPQHGTCLFSLRNSNISANWWLSKLLAYWNITWKVWGSVWNFQVVNYQVLR